MIQDFVTRLGLKVIDSKSITIDECVFEYVLSSKFIENIQYKEISQYFFVELNDNNIGLFDKDNMLVSFDKFQDKLISSLFFSYRNDLRWNMYLIFLFEDNFKAFNELPITIIENEENYARKFFLSYTDAEKYFNSDVIFNSKKNDLTARRNPIGEWVEVLKSVNLTAILTHSFQNRGNKDVNEYIYCERPSFDDEQFSFARDVNEINPELYKHLIPNRINKLNMGSFRKHCFVKNQTINPVLVNIIHGMNGSGKTSILEAIEFAATNEIKRLIDFGESCLTLPKVELDCISESGTPLKLDSNKNNDDNKLYDKIWYGTPTSRGASKTFNPNFNHFNYFNSEAAYKFALEESVNKTDYSDKLTKLLYDDELVEMEKRWQRYKEAFEDELEKIMKMQRGTKEKISSLRNELSNINLNKVEYSSNYLVDLLKLIHFCQELKYESNAHQQYQIYYNILISIKDAVSSLYNNAQELNIKNTIDLNDLSAKIRNNILAIKTKKDELIKNQDSLLVDLGSCKKQKDDINSKIVNAENLMSYMKDSYTNWNKYKILLQNETQIIQYKETKALVDNLKRKRDFIERFNIEYNQFRDLPLDFNVLSEHEIMAINNEIMQKSKELSELNIVIAQQENNISELNQYMIDLHDFADKLLEKFPQAGACPLCGSNFSDEKELLLSIKSNKPKLDLYQEKISHDTKLKKTIELEIVNLQEKIKRTSEKKKIINTIFAAGEFIEKTSLFSLNLKMNVNEVYIGIIKILNDYDSIIYEIQKMEKMITILHNQGYTDDNIIAANKFKTTNSYYLLFISEGNNSSRDYSDYILDTMAQKEIELKEYNANLTNLYNEESNLSERLKSIDMESIDNEMDSNSKLEKIIEAINNNIILLSDYMEIQNHEEYRLIYNNFNQVLLKLEIAIKELGIAEDLKAKNNQLTIWEKDAADLEKHFMNCNRAVIELRKLNSLKHYSLEFIEKNIQRIEYFFKYIHSPREFSQLKIIDGSITAIRDKDNAVIKAHQMSTGQRVSFALAVMFSSYISASKSPKFLLLDEPVANMDDLHLLNLIDVLRELALRGTQIFFTTANSEVAGIFRRKFSFFGHDFNFLEISRENNGYAEIEVTEYTPDKEDGNILVSAS